MANEAQIARGFMAHLTGNSLSVRADEYRQQLIVSFHPSQRRMFDDPAPVRVGVCGRRWGKTYLGAAECVLTALAGGRAWWVAPVYQISMVGWREMKRRVRDIPGAKIHKADQLIELPGGGEIFVKSAHNPDNLRGDGLDLAVLDEAAFIDPRVLPEIVLPMLDKPTSRLLLIGTPSGRNWYYQEWLRGLPHTDERDPDYSSYQLPTRDNPHFSQKVLDRNKRIMSDLEFRQEHEAEFLAYQGLVYPEFSRRIHQIETPGQRYPYYYGGVDWGFANPTVLLVFGVDGDGRMHLVEERYERQVQIEKWVVEAQKLQKQYGCETWFCDPENPTFIEQFQAGHIPAVEANNEVMHGIQAVKARLEKQADGAPRLTIGASAIRTAAEFESYMWMEHSRNGLQDKPRKANDHAMDALRYACVGVDSHFGLDYVGYVAQPDQSPIGKFW